MNIRRRMIPFWVMKYDRAGERLRKAAKADPGLWIEAQNRQIREFVTRLYEYPFYQARFKEAGIGPDDIRRAEDFHKLPPLTKEELRAWISKELAGSPEKYEGWMSRKTTGSTGLPLELRSKPEDRAREIANLFRCARHQENGYHPLTDRIFSTMVPEPANLYLSKIPFRAQMSSIASPAELLEGYNKMRPDFYYGNKTALLMIAREALDRGIELHRAKCVGSISESLDKNARAILDKAYGAGRVFDFYGCAEVGNFACDTAEEPGKYTIWHDTHVVNLYQGEGSGPHSSVGQIMLTSLVHYGFPIVNYLPGDYIEVSDENGVRYVTAIKGRINDVIKNRDGTEFHWMHIERIMHGIIDIVQFRVIQEQYDLLRFVIAADRIPDERKAEIETIIQTRADDFFGKTGNAKKIAFQWTRDIPPDQTGKVRILISKV